MPQQEIGLVRVLRLHLPPDALLVFHQAGNAVPLREIPEVARLAGGSPMPQVIPAADQEAPAAQAAGKAIVAADVLHHAMGYLDHGPHPPPSGAQVVA